jgi:hypothetical protein
MPHYPYVYDESCEPRPPSEWLARSDADEVDPEEGATNTHDGRAARYASYLQQIRCVHRQVYALLAAIPPQLRGDAVI